MIGPVDANGGRYRGEDESEDEGQAVPAKRAAEACPSARATGRARGPVIELRRYESADGETDEERADDLREQDVPDPQRDERLPSGARPARRPPREDDESDTQHDDDGVDRGIERTGRSHGANVLAGLDQRALARPTGQREISPRWRAPPASWAACPPT